MLLSGGGGGRCLSGGGRGSRGELPAEMQHIRKELQQCTTLTHSAYTFVVMSEDRQCNSSFCVHTLCPHLSTTRRKIRMLQQSAYLWQLCCPACVHNGLHEQELMRQAAHLAVLSCHYGCLSYNLAQSCHWSVQRKCGHALCAALYASCLSSHSLYLESENRGLR